MKTERSRVIPEKLMKELNGFIVVDSKKTENENVNNYDELIKAIKEYEKELQQNDNETK